MQMQLFPPVLRLSLIVGIILSATAVCAGIIGSNQPAKELTFERIAALPENQRAEWKQYLERSQKQLKADKDAFLAEMKQHGIKEATNAPASRGFRGVALNRTLEWYASEDAQRIGEIIISYQTPAGGWGKQVDMSRLMRSPGQLYVSDTSSRFLAPGDNDTPPSEVKWNYMGTFDNGATTTQLNFLAKVGAALPGASGAKYRAAFLKGLDYIYSSQYPNGGWPQIWPLEGGYHDAITYNDGSTVNVLEVLSRVAKGEGDTAFVPKNVRDEASQRIQKAIKCILETQIVVNGRKTVWCQQHDMLTLKPTSARNYEMPCLSSQESAGLMQFLMDLPNPGDAIVSSVHAAADWFKKTKLNDVAFRNVGEEGRLLVPSPGAEPLWSRYYDISTDKPIFGDRDKTIHDNVAEISKERRRGYSWFGDAPTSALKQYEKWAAAHPLK
jgi:PelA/Pel-15E family pectate lyase